MLNETSPIISLSAEVPELRVIGERDDGVSLNSSGPLKEPSVSLARRGY